MTERVKIAIIGSGPSGLSAAARAAQLGIPHVLLEASPRPADTIVKYQKGKHVMAEPAVLPLRSPLSFGEGSREKILQAWTDELAALKVNIRLSARVLSLSGEKSRFTLKVGDGSEVEAEFVVLAIGLQGNVRKLGVPGEDLERVQYQLDDPGEYEEETIVVIGAGDAAVENALALSKQNRVIICIRDTELSRCKEANLNLVSAAIQEGRVEINYSTAIERVEHLPREGLHGKSLVLHASSSGGALSIPCDRIIARLGATAPRQLVESFGVKFPNKNASAVPELSATYESNVPGLYIVGALAGYPLIKQAMNQGYEVVESILGRTVVPADEPLLLKRIAPLKRARSVEQAIQILRETVPLYSGLTTLQLREFLLESEFHDLAPGSTIIRRNDYTNSFFVVVQGEVLIHVTGDDGKVMKISVGAGGFFGEMGLISGRRRVATVTVGNDCVVLETPRRSMLKLIASVDSVRRTLDDVSLRRVVRNYLTRDLSDAELDQLVEGVVIKRFKADEILFKEGDAADGLYLIRRGSVTVSKHLGNREVVLNYVAAGNFVGEMALVSDAPRSATVRSALVTEAIVLQGAKVKALMATNESVRKAIVAKHMQHIRNDASIAQAESGNIISFLVKQGVSEASDILLIDQSICTRCDNCEKACAETHDGKSRLDREAGPSYASVHIPTSCRHCEHPHCMKDCPPDAIHRGAGGEVFITDACIGCGNCATNCPYSVIQMHAIDPAPRKPSLWQWLLFGRGPEPGTEAGELHGEGLAKKAVKCDMCQDLSGGPACVRACPAGAAQRVGPERFISLVKQRAAR